MISQLETLRTRLATSALTIIVHVGCGQRPTATERQADLPEGHVNAVEMGEAVAAARQTSMNAVKPAFGEKAGAAYAHRMLRSVGLQIKACVEEHARCPLWRLQMEYFVQIDGSVQDIKLLFDWDARELESAKHPTAKCIEDAVRAFRYEPPPMERQLVRYPLNLEYALDDCK